MSSPEAGQEKKPFNPADIYAPITGITTEREVLNLLIEQTSPLLPTRVLKSEERERRINIIGYIMLQLRLRYARVLDKNGFSRLADEVTENNFLMDIASICSRRNIPDLDERKKIRKELASIRDSFDAEILNVLGFLHQNIFSSPADKPSDIEPQLSLFTEAANSRNPLLRNLFPAWFPVSEITEPTNVVHALALRLRDMTEKPTEDQIAALQALQQYPAYARLAQWINDTNHDAAVEVHEAHKYLSKLLQLAAPHGPESQAHGTVSDYGTRSIVELLTFAMDHTKPIRKRFEAMRLLEWSIGFFSVERNPAFKAMRLVRKQIHEILTGEIFDPDGILLPMDLTKEADALMKEKAKKTRRTSVNNHEMVTMEDALLFLMERVRSNLKQHSRKAPGESTVEARNRRIILRTIADGLEKAVKEALVVPKEEKNPVILRARKLSNELREILDRGVVKGVINPEYADCVLFGSREKDKESLVRKIFLMQLLVQRAKATLDRHETGISTKEAREILKRYEQRMRDYGKRDEDIALKLVGFDALDDHVGISFVVNLARPLRSYKTPAEKNDVTDIFAQLGLQILDRLGLKFHGTESLLWKPNKRNKKSSPDYRVYKVHGDFMIEVDTFDANGNLKTESLAVPVEIQILPVKTYLHSFYPGDASKLEYERRKARDLATRIHPQKIADKEIFPQLLDTRHFVNVLNQTA